MATNQLLNPLAVPYFDPEAFAIDWGPGGIPPELLPGGALYLNNSPTPPQANQSDPWAALRVMPTQPMEQWGGTALEQFQTKFGSNGGPQIGTGAQGGWADQVRTFQRPGGDKYDLLQAIYSFNPQTGNFEMRGDPQQVRQQSGMSEFGEGVWDGVKFVGPIMAAAYGAGQGLEALGYGSEGLSGMDLAADAAIGSGNNIGTAAGAFGGGTGGFTTSLSGYEMPQEFAGVMNTGAQPAGSGAGVSSYGGTGMGGTEYTGFGATSGGGVAGGSAGGAAAGGAAPGMWSSLTSPNGLAQLGSAAIGMYGNNKAIGAYQDATNQANGLAQQQLDYTKELNAPLVGLRNSVLPQIKALLQNPSSIRNDPSYQFGLDEASRRRDNTMAAQGGYYSGNQLRRAGRDTADYTASKLDQSLNRLTNVAGLGQVGANNAQQGFQSGTNALAGNALNMGNARGSLYGGNAQLAGNALGNIFNDAQYRNMWGNGP